MSTIQAEFMLTLFVSVSIPAANHDPACMYVHPNSTRPPSDLLRCAVALRCLTVVLRRDPPQHWDITSDEQIQLDFIPHVVVNISPGNQPITWTQFHWGSRFRPIYSIRFSPRDQGLLPRFALEIFSHVLRRTTLCFLRNDNDTVTVAHVSSVDRIRELVVPHQHLEEILVYLRATRILRNVKTLLIHDALLRKFIAVVNTDEHDCYWNLAKVCVVQGVVPSVVPSKFLAFLNSISPISGYSFGPVPDLDAIEKNLRMLCP